MLFSHEELYVLYSGLEQLIENINQAKKLVYEEESQAALDKELQMYLKLKAKLMEYL